MRLLPVAKLMLLPLFFGPMGCAQFPELNATVSQEEASKADFPALVPVEPLLVQAETQHATPETQANVSARAARLRARAARLRGQVVDGSTQRRMAQGVA